MKLDRREFVDTNVVVYAFSADVRAARAQQILSRRCIISVQILNEFVNVAQRKLGMTWPQTNAALKSLRNVAADILPISLGEHARAVHIAERYRLRIFDALIVAAALESDCETLWSEDMQHGHVIGQLTIRNPFAST